MISVALLIFGCTEQIDTNLTEDTEMKSIIVESNSFSNGGEIPSKYTCDGNDISPHLKWVGVEGAKAYALLADDPDAPSGTWTHWRIINIPANKTELEEGESAGEELKTSFGVIGYGGPCPPSGTHRYYFKIFALDVKLDNVTAENFDSKIAEHTIAKGQIMGKYTRK